LRSLVWFRNDLRMADNPPLCEAAAAGEVVGVFLLATDQWRSHDVGDNRLAFLLDCLERLSDDLAALNIPLCVVRSPRFADAPRSVVRLAKSVGAGRLAFNREYPLNEQVRDSRVCRACDEAGIEVWRFDGGVILPPGRVLTNNGDPYTVYTPFRKRWSSTLTRGEREPLPAPQRQRPLTDVDRTPVQQSIDGVAIDRVRDRWPGGEAEAERRLQRFIGERAQSYEQNRDLPALPGTSELSPYLSVGAISARRCLAAALDANGGRLGGGRKGLDSWISELVWRDFYRHVVAQFPHVSRGESFKREMDALPWRQAPAELAAWQEGRTGYPLVDAAMRQLNETGWMHNRLRMLTAMFLTKHLLIDWREGERYFMERLVDGDFAANNGGWQWSAATGTDAAPYFRIFNPTTQAERFDSGGDFIRRYLPELAELTVPGIFQPGAAGYAEPVVEHKAARERALAFFKSA